MHFRSNYTVVIIVKEKTKLAENTKHLRLFNYTQNIINCILKKYFFKHRMDKIIK